MRRSRRRWSSSGSRRRRVAAVPEARHLGGLHLHLRPGRRRRARGSPGCGSTASPIVPATVVLGDGELVPGHRWRQLPRASPTARASRHRQTDLQAMVDYMAEFANTGEGDPPLPVPVEAERRRTSTSRPARRRRTTPGEHVMFNVSGWSFTSPSDPRDTEVVVKLGATTLGTFPLNNTAPSANPPFDDTGKAAVDVVLPDLPPGAIRAEPGRRHHRHRGDRADPGRQAWRHGRRERRHRRVREGDPDPRDRHGLHFGKPTGTVEVFDGSTSLGTATVPKSGTATVTARRRLGPRLGTHSLRAEYSGDGTYRCRSRTRSR